YISDDEEVIIKSSYYEATKKKILVEYDAALSLYRQCIALDPGNAASYYKMAVAQLGQGNITQAAMTYEEAEKKLGYNEQVSLNVVELYERAKDYANAERVIQELIN